MKVRYSSIIPLLLIFTPIVFDKFSPAQKKRAPYTITEVKPLFQHWLIVKKEDIKKLRKKK